MPSKELLDSSKRDLREKLESKKLGRLKRLLRLRDRNNSKLPESKEKRKLRESSLKEKLPSLSMRRELNKKDSSEKQDFWK